MVMFKARFIAADPKPEASGSEDHAPAKRPTDDSANEKPQAAGDAKEDRKRSTSATSSERPAAD